MLAFLDDMITNPYELETAVFENNRHLLTFAVLRNKFSIVDRIVSAYPKSINLQDDSGHTALFYSIIYKKSISFMSLLKYGADPNIKDKQGITVMKRAALNQQ